MTRIRKLVLMLCFFMVAHKAAWQTLPRATKLHGNLAKGLLEVYEDMVEVLLVLEIFLTELKICSVVLLPAEKPACSSAMIFSACGFCLFSMIFSMTLLW